ncbi:MAG: DUF3307 domain-containing protein [Sciscionella sp.]
MSWVDVFAVLVVSHLAGDYMLQTEWQASHKRGGLGRDPLRRRALASHVASYTVAFVPALVWLWGRLHMGVIGIAALIAITHLIQDDGRLLARYALTFKGADLAANPGLAAKLDQSLHVLTLFGVALLAAS